MFTIESVARILVITKESGTIARKTGSPFVQFISREINQATSSLTFSTRNSILETQYSKLSRIEYRVSRLKGRGLRDCQLTFERYCKIMTGSYLKKDCLTVFLFSDFNVFSLVTGIFCKSLYYMQIKHTNVLWKF